MQRKSVADVGGIPMIEVLGFVFGIVLIIIISGKALEVW